jgi:hypothetical protein
VPIEEEEEEVLHTVEHGTDVTTELFRGTECSF